MEGVTICFGCKHLNKVSDDVEVTESDYASFDGTQTPACAAFPNGIPREIYYYSFDHRNQFADEKLFFELNDDPDMIEDARLSLKRYDTIIRQTSA